MGITNSEAWDAIRDAHETVRQGDFIIQTTASLCMGRLELAKVDNDVLFVLKKELQDFNMRTRAWKKR